MFSCWTVPSGPGGQACLWIKRLKLTIINSLMTHPIEGWDERDFYEKKFIREKTSKERAKGEGKECTLWSVSHSNINYWRQEAWRDQHDEWRRLWLWNTEQWRRHPGDEEQEEQVLEVEGELWDVWCVTQHRITCSEWSLHKISPLKYSHILYITNLLKSMLMLSASLIM